MKLTGEERKDEVGQDQGSQTASTLDDIYVPGIYRSPGGSR